LLLVLTAFAAAIALASVVATAGVVAANTAAAALRLWLVVVLPTPSSAGRYVIRRFRHLAIVNALTTGRPPLSPTFASRCSIPLVLAIHHLRRSTIDGWLLLSPTTQQHNNRTTKLKTFSCSHIWTYFDLLRA
jgi:type IV secretory pathway protease TraF